MTRPLLIGVLAGALVLVAAASVLGVLPHAAGPEPWWIARASGVTALVALSLDVSCGLMLSTGAGKAWLPRGLAVELHRWLSPITLALVAGHAAILLVDGAVPFDALDLLVPFVAPYRPAAVGVGVIAAYLAVVVHVSFALRKRIGTRWWRRLHALSFVSYAGALIHTLAAGTDAARPWMLAVVGPPVVVVFALLARRICVPAT